MKSFLQKFDILTFNTIDSTNDEAKRIAKSGLNGKFLICADQQTNGRGQNNRNWISPKGNLHFSLLFESPKALDKVSELIFIMANLVAESVEKADIKKMLHPGVVTVKWPNDILINRKKVAGILIETIQVNDKIFVIIGVGVNIEHIPDISEKQVTSIWQELGHKILPDFFMEIMCSKFSKEYDKWLISDDFSDIRNNWLRRAFFIGKEITIKDGEKTISGLFKSIDYNGNIILELANGDVISINHGEILF